MSNKACIAVIGDGGWGTTLAILLSHKGHNVTLWSAFRDYAEYLEEKRVNDKFLPGFRIPAGIKISSDLESAICAKEIVVLAVPSQHLRKVLRKIKRCPDFRRPAYLSATKGIELGSLKRMSQVISEELGRVRLAVLSGPTIAHEVACGSPAAAVIASKDSVLRRRLQGVFMSETFRIYTNSDVVGVELGGSVKNVIAIACGISDGLKFGTNTKAALLARGLAEISRLGLAMGAKIETFSGVSGLGDLVTTCISSYSRNRFVGQEIARGKLLSKITDKMQMVAEGVPTAKCAYSLGLKYRVDMPIIREVYKVLYKGKAPLLAVKDLMKRQKKEEY